MAKETVVNREARHRVLLIDDHAILREGLRALIELESDFEVVGEAGSFAEARSVAEAMQPDLIISDLSVPDSIGVRGIVEVRERCPGARLVVLTVHNTEEHIRAALTAGADGYVLKDSCRAEFIQGLRAAMDGQLYLCPRASERIMRSYLGEQLPLDPALAGMTAREREILAMIASGQSNKRIAQLLNRSVKTIEKHRANLMRKLGLHNVADVTRFALKSGLISPGESGQPGASSEAPRNRQSG